MTLNLNHPSFARRTALQAGAVGILGLGLSDCRALADRTDGQPGEVSRGARNLGTRTKAKSVIYIFLSGGLAQQDSFDLKPDAPDNIRGEFKPIATRAPGVFICEHLPLLAQRSHLWALVRSLTHPSNDHSAGHHIMLTGRSGLPLGFDPNTPKASDWPSLASVARHALVPRDNLPPAAVLPERLIHFSGRVIPGQFAGEMGKSRDPWFIEASPYHPKSYGAYPTHEFHHATGRIAGKLPFAAPNLTLPPGLFQDRLRDRMGLLATIEAQQRSWEKLATVGTLDRHRQAAISLLAGGKVRRAMDVTQADSATQERYGRNSFGWSLLMARRLVEAGVGFVQVNLGNNETWDTHGNAFPHLKDFLFPPTDRALSALLDDLAESGQLDETLIVMAGEFGRTPKITTLPQHYKLPGRDHWGAVQSVFLAGGGVRGGVVVGASDRIGGYPSRDPQTPENLAATIFHHLGIPKNWAWHDDLARPHFIYHGDPIRGLT